MKDTERPAVTWLTSYTRNTFRRARKRHLLLTGAKGCGKTTLVEALVAPWAPSGVRSFVQLGADGLPAHVLLSQRNQPRSCIIGRRDTGTMLPQRDVLNTVAVEMLCATLAAEGEWVVVDEIGFLEEASPRYQQALLQLFEQKRVLAVLRKDTLPFLSQLRRRKDCFVLDLDEWEGWA